MKKAAEFPERIILVGFMGSGKTTIGKLVAEELGYKLVDTDQLIEEQEGMSVSQIFSFSGEEHFRDLESACIGQLSMESRLIICTGGGLPMYNNNMQALLRLGTVIFLKVGVETVLNRVGLAESRPLLSGKSTSEKRKFIKQKLNERNPVYEKASMIIAAGRPAQSVAMTIIKKLRRME